MRTSRAPRSRRRTTSFTCVPANGSTRTPPSSASTTSDAGPRSRRRRPPHRPRRAGRGVARRRPGRPGREPTQRPGHPGPSYTDAAGRRQYLYHPAWRQRRDAAKFDHVLTAAQRLPRLRRRVAAHLRRPGLTRERVLAAMVSVLDRGLFRIGGDQYVTGDDATFGLATLQASHVRLARGEAVFRYPAKGGIERECRVSENGVVAVLRALARPRA